MEDPRMLIRYYVAPVIVGLLLGGGASYVGVRVALAEHRKTLEFVQESHKDLRGQVRAHIKSDGHPVNVERVRALSVQVTRLETP